MSDLLKIVFDSATLWIYSKTLWVILVSSLYDLSVPWIVWATIVILLALRFTRNPPSDPKNVLQVLGSDPFVTEKNGLTSDTQGNGKQYCMRVVAHRGGGYDYPENSLTAIKNRINSEDGSDQSRNVKSLITFGSNQSIEDKIHYYRPQLEQNSKEKGCTAVEFDLAFTKDNIPIIFHDETIERLTGKPGIIKEMTWDELKQLDISETHPLREKFNRAEPIALFDDVLEECLNNGQHIFIDIKEKSLEIIDVILDAYKKYPELFERAVVSSFYPNLIYAVRRREPKIVTSLAWRPKFFSTISYGGLDGPGPARYRNPFKHCAACMIDALHEWTLPRFTYYILGISAIVLHKDVVSPEVINRWRNRGIRVIAWTVNLPSEKMHFSRLLKITYMTDTLLAEKVT